MGINPITDPLTFIIYLLLLLGASEKSKKSRVYIQSCAHATMPVPITPPSPSGPSTLMASPIDGPKTNTPDNHAHNLSPMNSPQASSEQTLQERNLSMSPVPPPISDDSLPLESPEELVVPESPTKLTSQDQYSSWSTGLYDCRSDMDTCCLVFWCPCIAFGRMAEVLDEGKSSCCCKGTLYSLIHVLSIAVFVLGAPVTFHFLLSYKYRGKLKRHLNLPPSCREDFFAHLCCEFCALCQEYRELQTHGYDLSLGWHGNMDKPRQTTPTTLSAPRSPTMKR